MQTLKARPVALSRAAFWGKAILLRARHPRRFGLLGQSCLLLTFNTLVVIACGLIFPVAVMVLFFGHSGRGGGIRCEIELSVLVGIGAWAAHGAKSCWMLAKREIEFGDLKDEIERSHAHRIARGLAREEHQALRAILAESHRKHVDPRGTTGSGKLNPPRL